MAREKVDLEEKREKEKRSSEEAAKRAQKRIAKLEEHNKMLKDEIAKMQAKSKEAEAAMKAAGEEKERSKEEVQKEAKKIVAKLEGEVVNGRKLIEDLQAAKRRDRRLWLELRAQLLRQTHAAPPSHINPLRFGGSAQLFMGPLTIAAGPSAFPYTTPPIAVPIVNLPSPSSLPPRATQVSSPRATVCLPRGPQPTRAQLLVPTSPPFNAPKGPKGGRHTGPNRDLRGPKESQ